MCSPAEAADSAAELLAAVALLVTALVLVLRSGGEHAASTAGNTTSVNSTAETSNRVVSVALQPGSMELQSGQKRKFMVAVLPSNAGTPPVTIRNGSPPVW